MTTLVLIHIGEQWPHYLKDCIKQARLINPTSTLVFLVNKSHSFRTIPLQTIYKLTVIYIEDLQPSEQYNEFVSKIVSMVDLQFRKKYWQYVFERFFLLERYCQQYNPGSVYMIETDTMVYVPLDIVKTTETLFSQGMALPFDNLHQGYPCFVFFRNTTSVLKFTRFMLNILRNEYQSDMKILALYWKQHPEEVFPYPVLPPSCNTPLRDRSSYVGLNAKKEETAFLSNSQFPILFDAIAFGQALGGVDPRNSNGTPTFGYVNESALYTVHETQFRWIQLEKLWFPLVNNLPLVNLHIHCKALYNFLSDSESTPGAHYDTKDLENALNNDLKGAM
jgi:hypothetical protein